MTFENAIQETADHPQTRHLLLGNGFSIACRPDCFSYGALLNEAEFADASSDIHAIFELLGTVDFEKVIDALRFAAQLVEHYDGDPVFAATIA